ncbi:energy transducer TonB [Lewinella sp. IMCC34183]|uniref:energy transducer TonB n=1 Tax=Lewinella sp. IMCC34183 TaxID=2248762 RepID=UPI000E22C0DC|nr:energy transducer TonB [Lewinella sp. IMCC34183]
MQYLTLFFLLFAFTLSAQEKTEARKGPDEDGVYNVVEEMPMFLSDDCPTEGSRWDRKPCADKAMLEFVYENVTYPAVAQKAEAEGMAVVSFIVEPDGTISEPTLQRDPGTGLGEEALRVVQLMQTTTRWEPGLQNGKPVRARFNLPVKFDLGK